MKTIKIEPPKKLTVINLEVGDKTYKIPALSQIDYAQAKKIGALMKSKDEMEISFALLDWVAEYLIKNNVPKKVVESFTVEQLQTIITALSDTSMGE